VTVTFEIIKTGIISPKAGEKIYRAFTRERKEFLLPTMNEISLDKEENRLATLSGSTGNQGW
jgi:hypothetical protein